MTGTIAGIARHAQAFGPIETLDSVEIEVGHGLAGDFRGSRKPGRDGRRGVSLIEAGDWADAMAEIGGALPWYERRANLLVEGFDLPKVAGTRLRIGTAVLEVTCECDPCSRMDALAPGLRAALEPDWRGGALARVIEAGTITLGDRIGIVE